MFFRFFKWTGVTVPISTVSEQLITLQRQTLLFILQNTKSDKSEVLLSNMTLDP